LFERGWRTEKEAAIRGEKGYVVHILYRRRK